jgi:Bacterial SH3 domain
MVGLLKFFIGFCLGIIILAGGAGLTAYYFFTKSSVIPPRPTFPEEIEKKDKSAGKNQNKNSSNNNKNNNSPNKESGLYKGKIIPEQGVSLREKPTTDSNRVGGIAGNATVVVLEESEDKRWLKIRNDQGYQVGWIRSRSLEKL